MSGHHEQTQGEFAGTPEHLQPYGGIPNPAAYPIVGHNPRPHRCPICYGRGSVPADFYTAIGYATSTSRETCRSCGGRGVIVA